MTRFLRLTALMLTSLAPLFSTARAADPPHAPSFHRDRLVAWCIVPFDARQRGPAERAEMVKRLGITRVAYDWRESHVATFEEEILQYQKQGIEYFAFWSWHPAMEPLIQKHSIHPQIWWMFASPPEGPHEDRVKAAATSLLPMVEKTARLKLKLGLYNHGGWSGEPQNLVDVCRYLREHHQAEHVGIVYNLHHAHDHIQDFPSQLELLKPWLLCLNLNGMNDNAQPKILPIGSGQHDQRLLQIILSSGYDGPIGIIDHREQLDAEESLQQNLSGLQALLAKVGQTAAAQSFAKP
ncbi:MAG: sugar phosphate isomerase/epimerase family protein [Planctomycetota bacterium]